jgi:putative multiple sugar transport system permease protein
MFIALFIIVVFFTIATDGLFISPRNILNLVNQTGYIAVLAIGMTLVIVIRHIDLSVGFLAGFLGAVAAIAMVSWNLPVWVVIPFVLVLGILAGRLTSFMVADLGIPAFVATLAGWLGYRGALQLVTRSTGTIIIPNDSFNAIGNGFIPEVPFAPIIPGIHNLTFILGLFAIVLFVSGELINRVRIQRQNGEVQSMEMFTIKLVAVSALIGAVTWILAGYRGLSWTAVVILIVVFSYNS